MTFAAGVSNFADRKKKELDLTVRKITLECFRRVINRSPVGNPELWLTLIDGTYKDFLTYRTAEGYVGGRFRANWMFSEGSPSTEVTTLTDKTDGTSMARITSGLPEQAAGRIFYLANNLPYANRLEHGYSSQAPKGMVKLTKMEFSGIVRGFVLS